MYNGTLRLDVLNDGSIMDGSGNPLAAAYSIGEMYTITKSYVATLPSQATYDGWILESKELSSVGGSINNLATTIRVGDDALNRQYRSILSFSTSALPGNAVITSVTLKFKYAGKSGTLPFSTHSNLIADIRKGAFSSNLSLQLSDFNALASQAKMLIYTNSPVENWYSQSLNPASFMYIKPNGKTQFRLRFGKDDNNDFGADFLKIYSGNAAEADRPQLIVEYFVP
jgi:hypothetical protein